MALKKGEEYIASLKSLGLEAHVMGKKTQDLPDHPLVTPSVRAVAYLIESVHGAGSPMAQRIMIGRQGEIESKINRVKGLLGIP